MPHEADPTYGARPMRRSVERFPEDPLAEEILKASLHEGDPVQVTVENNKLVFSQNTPATGARARFLDRKGRIDLTSTVFATANRGCFISTGER